MISTPYTALSPTDDFGMTVSNEKYSASLAITTDTTLAVPDTAPRFKAVIRVESGGDVWVANNDTAAVPAGGTFASTTSELVVGGEAVCREVRNSDVLHFYTATASTDVSVVFYALGNTVGV